MISLRRPVARTAARKSASSHALVVVRSIGGLSSSSSASSGTVGCPRPVATLIVEWTIGRSNAFAVFTVETMFCEQQVTIDRPDSRELGRLVVDHEQRRVLRRQQVVADRVAYRERWPSGMHL